MKLMQTLDGPKIKIEATRRLVPIMADATADVPTRIEVMKAGNWPSGSNKGALSITIDDLYQFKTNFDNGVGMPNGLHQLPIDYMHEDWNKAAGWITNLTVEGDTLLADVNWTPAGRQALIDGDFKCFSPSFWPACLGEWQDPEDPAITARNVLVGAGLTNIPFFKDLTPLMASNTSDKDGKNNNVIYISADERNQMPTLDEIRVKDADKLSDEEKQLLTEHKAELSTEELAKFDLADKPVDVVKEEVTDKEETPVAEEVKEAVAIAASVKAGEKVLMSASDVKAMNEKIDAAAKQLNAYKEREVKASVVKHLERGAIKADQVDNWTAKILADESLADLLAAVPDNKVMAAEMGNTEKEADTNAYELLKEKASKISADRNMTWSNAMAAARQENPELATESDSQLAGN